MIAKFFFSVLIGTCIVSRLYAQPGVAEMGEARTFIRESFFSMSDLSYALAALIAIAGAIRVYHKMQLGQDVTLDIPAWFFSALFIIVINVVLVHVFGL